jgi:hypothetical protein
VYIKSFSGLNMDRKNQNDKPQPENTSFRQSQSNQEPAAIGHWKNISGKWEQYGPPLRPSVQDIALHVETINSWSRDNSAPRALILGVTPELYHLPWPDGTDILAVDRTQDMIDNIWPGPRNTAILAHWTDMPLQAASRDILLCDGGINQLTYPHGLHQFIKLLFKIIVPDGLCILRLFVPPKERETFDKVFQDLLDGKIPDMNHLKLRLWMAMYKDITQSLPLKHVWDTFHQVAPDFNDLASQIGWPLEHLLLINTHRDSRLKFIFPSVDEVSHLFCQNPGGFKLETVRVPTYELGEFCPTVVFRRNHA